MKIVDKRLLTKPIHFSETSPGDVFRHIEDVYMSVYDHGSGETFGVDLAAGQVVYFASDTFVYPISAEVSIMS